MGEIKNRIKYLLDIRNYTQGDFASMLGISYVALNNIINNKSNPSIAIAMNMAKIFNVSVEDIFYEESDYPLTLTLNEKINDFDQAKLEEKENILKDIIYSDILNLTIYFKAQYDYICKLLEFEYEWKEDTETGLYDKFDNYVNFQLRNILKEYDKSINDNIEFKISLEKLLDAVARYNQKLIDKNIKFPL